MKTLRETITEAEKNKVAIGHFNIADLVTLKAIFKAARDMGVPVVIGTSEGERDFIGIHEAVALIKSLRDKYGYPIFINADHTRSVERAKEAIDAGYDAVLFDGAHLSFEENIKETKKVVEYAKLVGNKQNREILVEGELGYIGTSSKIFEEVPKGAAIEEKDMTKPEEAEKFVKETKVNLFAPAVGNLHGMFKNTPNPNLNIERIREIKNSAGVPLVLHGGSGITDKDLVSAVKAGVTIVHISTELRLAWREGIEQTLREKPYELAPYNLLSGAASNIEKVVIEHLKLFSGRQ